MGIVVGYVIFFNFKFLRFLLDVEILLKPFSPMSLLITKWLQVIDYFLSFSLF